MPFLKNLIRTLIAVPQLMLTAGVVTGFALAGLALSLPSPLAALFFSTTSVLVGMGLPALLKRRWELRHEPDPPYGADMMVWNRYQTCLSTFTKRRAELTTAITYWNFGLGGAFLPLLLLLITLA